MADSDTSRFREFLQGEIDSAHIYRVLAALEREPALLELYTRLAATE